MLFVFEIMFLIVMGLIAIVTIVTVGRPLAIAYADKVKSKHAELDPEKAQKMELRISALEEETRDLRRQLSVIEEANKFQERLIEGGKS